jgi:hypothetical protein
MSEPGGGEIAPIRETEINPQKWESGHKHVALERLREILRDNVNNVNPDNPESNAEDWVQEKEQKLDLWLGAIDDEAVKNFEVFESNENLGVKFPLTKIHLNKVANSVQNTSLGEGSKEAPKKTIVVFTPFIPPPGGGPDDIMNNIYDRVLIHLPEIAAREGLGTKDITVYGLGLPTSSWGSLTEEWVKRFETNGFSEYGGLYAELLSKVLSNGNGNIQFFAGSMGTVLANETAKKMPEELQKRMILLLNNPTGVHDSSERTIKLPIVGNIPLSLKGLQVVAGFAVEARLRMTREKFVKQAISGAVSARQVLSNILKKKGIFQHESDEQVLLKKRARDDAVKFLMKGNPLDTDNRRTFIEQGMYDLATTSAERIKFMRSRTDKNSGFYKAGERSLGMGVSYTHWMDPMRWPDKWLRGIEAFERHSATHNKN